MDGSIVYTTPSSKSTVKINLCNCKTDRNIGGRENCDWTCAKAGIFYCPNCNLILCSYAVSAPAEEIHGADINDTRWRCIYCHVYVFEMNPITSTALEMGLPIRIEDGENYVKNSARQNRPGSVQDTHKCLLQSESILDNTEVDQGQMDNKKS